MKNQRTSRVLLVLLLCILLVTPCLLCPVWAAAPERCSLALSYTVDKQPMADVPFQVYRVADVDMERLRYHATEKYADYHVLNAPGSWLERASTLAAYVSRDQLEADARTVTDENGQLRFEALEPGLYLITGASTILGELLYTPTPFLLSLPNTQDGLSWEYDVVTHVKSTCFALGNGSTQRHALKVWEDEGHEEVRPASVTVELLRDGAVYATAVLSAENNWRCDWTDLPADANWQVTELDLGEHYAVSIQPSGASFVITNTHLENITEDDPPLAEMPGDNTEIVDAPPPLGDLPQTGLLWWPVPLLAMLGLVLLCFGCILHRKGVRDEE